MARLLKVVLGVLSGWGGYVLVFALGALLAGAGAWNWQANGYARQLSERGRELAEQRAQLAGQVADAVNAARQEEQRRTAAQQEVAEHATKQRDAARADADASHRAADGLRQQLAAYLAASRRAGPDSGAAGAGPAAGDPLGVLADVLERADRRAGILAEYADGARIAGLACERAYDALTGAPEVTP